MLKFINSYILAQCAAFWKWLTSFQAPKTHRCSTGGTSQYTKISGVQKGLAIICGTLSRSGAISNLSSVPMGIRNHKMLQTSSHKAAWIYYPSKQATLLSAPFCQATSDYPTLKNPTCKLWVVTLMLEAHQLLIGERDPEKLIFWVHF